MDGVLGGVSTMAMLTFGISSSIVWVVESCVEDEDLDLEVRFASTSLCNALSIRVPQLNKDLALSIKNKMDEIYIHINFYTYKYLIVVLPDTLIKKRNLHILRIT